MFKLHEQKKTKKSLETKLQKVQMNGVVVLQKSGNWNCKTWRSQNIASRHDWINGDQLWAANNIGLQAVNWILLIVKQDQTDIVMTRILADLVLKQKTCWGARASWAPEDWYWSFKSNRTKIHYSITKFNARKVSNKYCWNFAGGESIMLFQPSRDFLN